MTVARCFAACAVAALCLVAAAPLPPAGAQTAPMDVEVLAAVAEADGPAAAPRGRPRLRGRSVART